MIDKMGIFRTNIEIVAFPAIAVFAHPGDLILLGAHGLEGMNLRVDLPRRELVPAGPVPAAAADTG